MAFTTQTPCGEAELHIPDLGTVKGLLYPNGVRQFLGIPYATLAKRWTRTKLATSWPNNFHDGRDLGSQAPNPPQFRCTGDLTPIDTFPHLTEPIEDEATCLIVNIVLPPKTDAEELYPIMFYIHGGSLVFGGGNRSIFDGVNLVSRSVAIGKPVVSINMNYRVGLGGFLASKDILEDLKKDGYGGVGNFGLTDQQTALEWVQKYIPTFGGDKDNVTVFGLSAGGISIGHLLRAKQPAVFHRAISMSGVESTIQTLSLQSHEEIYQRLLAYFKIDGSAPDALEQLRAIPEVQVADSTFEVYATINVISSPCDDGHFHISPPDRSVYHTPPEWLKSYMAGVVGEEGEIFVNSVDPAIDYQWVKDVYAKSMTATEAEMILKLYGLSADADADAIVKFIKTLQGDWAFSIHLWKTLQASTLPETYGYHFDLTSKVKSPLFGTAFHALDLQYVFLNMHADLGEEDLAYGHLVAGKYIGFAYGEAPWEPYHPNRKWGIFTRDYKIVTKTEKEDDPFRHYSAWEKIEEEGLLSKFMHASQVILNSYK